MCVCAATSQSENVTFMWVQYCRVPNADNYYQLLELRSRPGSRLQHSQPWLAKLSTNLQSVLLRRFYLHFIHAVT